MEPINIVTFTVWFALTGAAVIIVVVFMWADIAGKMRKLRISDPISKLF